MNAEPDEIEAKRCEAEAALRRGDRDRAVALLRAGRAAAEELADGDSAMVRSYAWCPVTNDLPRCQRLTSGEEF